MAPPPLAHEHAPFGLVRCLGQSSTQTGLVRVLDKAAPFGLVRLRENAGKSSLCLKNHFY